MKNPLRYGQIISIQPSEMDKLHLTSDGYIKTKAQLFEIDKKKVACGSLFFQSLFQIYPKFVTTRIEQTQGLEKELQKSKYTKESNRSQKLQDLEEKLIQEYKLNIEAAEKMKNQTLSMAQAVQFLHLSSNKFLACIYLEAEQEKENFKLELSEFPSENSCFRLMAAYSHQTRQDGLIYSEEPLFIIMDKMYLGLKPYFHIGMDTKHYDNTQLLMSRTLFSFPNQKTLQRKILQGSMKSKGAQMDPSNIQEPTTHLMLLPLDYKKKADLEHISSIIATCESILKKEVNVSLEHKSPFQISIFCAPVEDENTVYFGDVLWLHHIELNAILVTLKNNQDEIVVSLQQTKSDQLGEFIGNTNGMWFIEHVDLQGGPVEWGQIFRLRHFSLGKYLAIQKIGDLNSCFYLDDHPNDNSLIQFLPLPSSINENQKYVTKDAFFKLKGANEWIQFIDQNPEAEVHIVMLRLSDTCKDDDVLKCYKANLSEVQETSFLISCFPVLRKNLLMLKHLRIDDRKNRPLEEQKKMVVRQMEKLKFLKRIQQLQKVLQDLNRFCNNQFLASSQNRQKVLKEQYFIDILMDILNNISDEDEINVYLDMLKRKQVSTNNNTIETINNNLSNVMKKQVNKLKQSGLANAIYQAQKDQVNKQFKMLMYYKCEVIKMIYKLLISICYNNRENEQYVYQRIIKFQYQAKFFKETTDFIRSLLQNNESLLINLTDNVRLSEKQRRRDTQSRDSIYMAQRFAPGMQELNDKKNLVLFYKHLTEESQESRNCLEFFRTISKFGKKGLSVNQEIIHKFMQSSTKFRSSLFLPIKIEDQQFKIKFNDQYLTISEFNESQQDYVVALLNFYSDLALTRNFLWKEMLIMIFPMEFIFSSIFDSNQPFEIRSAFCNIALTVYIDHEPFNMLIVPNLCRLINYQPLRPQDKENDKQKHQILVQQVLEHIHGSYNELKDGMVQKAKQKRDAKALYKIEMSLPRAQLQLDIVKLAKTLIQFDIVSLVNRRDIYSNILPPLIFFLEYDRNDFLISYILNHIREENLKNSRSSQKILSKVKGMVTGAIDLGKTLVSVILKKENLEEEFAEETLFSKHPIVSSLITLSSYIQQFHVNQDTKTNKIDIDLKLQICELLIFFQELRLDFLLSNFLQFYVQKMKKSKDPKKLKYELEMELLSILPPTLRTGIEEPTEKGATNLVSAMGSVFSKMSNLLQQKKFSNYTSETEMPDLDQLMSGPNKDALKQAVLPSLLVTFHSSNDCSLLDNVVEVIRRCFSQKEELFDNLSQLEILFDQSEINSYQLLINILYKLRQLTESSEVWLTKFTQDSRADSSELQKVQEIVRMLYALLQKHTVVTQDLEIMTHSDSSLISPTRQKVFTFLSGHVPLINFIRDSQNQLVKVLKDKLYSSNSKVIVLELLKSIYQCLTHFCKNNNKNQVLLAQYIDLFLDEIEQDFGQTDLVCQIYKDNKFLCENIPDARIRQMLQFINECGRQGRFLDLLKVIQVCNAQTLVENQLRILTILLPHSKDEDVGRHEYWLYGQYEKEGLVFKLVETSQHRQHKQFDEPYKYHCKLIDVLLLTTHGEESFKLNAPKLKHLLKLGYLVDMLLQPDELEEGSMRDIGHLKTKVILFINWIYLNNELTQQEVIIREQIKFLRLFALEKERLARLGSFLDRSEYIKYIFTYLITLFTNYNTRMITQGNTQDFRERDDYEQLSSIMNIIISYTDSILAATLQIQQYNNMRKFILSLDELQAKQLAPRLIQCLIQSELKSSFKKVSAQQQQDEQQFKTSGKKPLILTIFNQEEKKFLTSNVKQDLKLSQVEPNLSIKRTPGSKGMSIPKITSGQQQHWANQATWLQFLDICKSTQLFESQILFERKTLAYAIYRIDRLIPDHLKKSVNIQLDFKSFLKKFIKYIEQGIMNNANKQNLIYSLQLLEEILGFGNLEEMQNLFDQQNATKMILNIIADYKNYPFDEDFFNQLLSFACRLCDGGNLKIQKTIFNYFANLTRSENIFCKIHMIFNEHIDELKMKYKLQNEVKQAEKEALNLETEVGLQMEPQTSQMNETKKTSQLSESILLNLLRFVQLFCEGHNLDLQNYIRQQFNSRNNYNLVQAIIELLYMYHFEITNDNYDNILKCLDTLTEFVQGPCSQNQQTIIDSKFLEVANTLLSMNTAKKVQGQNSKTNISEDQSVEKKSYTTLTLKSKANKGYKRQLVPQIEKYMLERIKYKVMVLVSSLLELNSDSLAIKRIMRSLPIEILKKNLKSIYKRYNKLYGSTFAQESLKHMDSDPTDPNLNKLYHEVILETGFYIYFLISYYSELDTQEIDIETSTELQKVKESALNKNIFLDSLIGQLLKFAFQIVGGVLTTINQIREYLQKRIKQKMGNKLDQSEIDKRNQIKKNLDQDLFRETIKFFAQNSAHIEVVRNSQIERIHFFKPPYCNYLPKETKKEFHETVNRDSTNSKIADLIERTTQIIQVCKLEEQLAVFFSKNTFIAIFANYVILWRDLAFLLTLLINILIILSYEATTNEYEERVNNPKLMSTSLTVANTEQLFMILGIMMIVCSTFVVIFFLLKKAPLYIREAWGQFDLSEYGLFINTIFQLLAINYCIAKVLLNIEVLYYLTYGALAFIGTFIHPFFFAFHLTEVVIRFPTLRNIIRSFWEPKIALLLTFILIILSNYFFTLIAYVFFSDEYQGKCETLLYCFLETFDKAFKNNGGIGGWLDSNDPQDPSKLLIYIANYNYGRFLFENLYNILIVIIMIQIFSGIIIDTFSSLREKQLQRDTDIQEICYICGFSRELFDRKSEAGFKLHIKYEHYMWNYVYYISYILDKEPTEYTGIESYIADKLKNYDNTWIPINKSLTLKNMDVESAHYETAKLQEIQVEMDSIRKNVSEIVKSMEELNEQLN